MMREADPALLMWAPYHPMMLVLDLMSVAHRRDRILEDLDRSLTLAVEAEVDPLALK